MAGHGEVRLVSSFGVDFGSERRMVPLGGFFY